jgi:hypothetical protein
MFVPDMNEYNSLEEFRQLREKFVRDRTSCTHWPLELIIAGMYERKFCLKKNLYIIDRGLRDDKKPLKLNTFQRSLIIGTDVEPENRTEEIDF